MKALTRTLVSLSVALFALQTAKSQNATSYLNDIGSTAYGVNVPVENGFINLSNGNLHLEFALSSHPQRGALSLSEKITYDSRIWNFAKFGTHGSYHWWPYNIFGASTTSAGWQFVTGGEVGAIGWGVTSSQSEACQSTDPGGPQQPLQGGQDPGGGQYNGPYVHHTSSLITWTDPAGSLHPFNASVSSTENECDPSQNTSSLNGGNATDGSGYHIPTDTSGKIRIIDANGTQVYPNISDRYGNMWSLDANSNLTDDTGVIPVLVTQNGLVTYYDVLTPNGPIDNQGKRTRYTVTRASIDVHTIFHDVKDSDIYDWHSPDLLTPVQSIALPDGSQYSFTYSVDGELATMTLPTGGVIRYTYSNFVDSSNTENNWVVSHQRGSEPAETFTPAVGTPCTNYSGDCVEFVTHHRPSGDETLHKLTLANGAWNTDTAVYSGPVPPPYQHPTAHPPASNLLSYTTTTYTYSNACSGVNCVGSNYVASALATTVVATSGATYSAYSQSFSNFDSQTGKPTSVKEWDYSSDMSSVNYTTPPSRRPDRDTEYAYTGLDLGAVFIYDGGGQLAGETTYAYTNSAAPPAGPVPGWSADNAGGPYLAAVQHWVNTSQIWPTTHYTLDTTGMVTGVVDPNQVPTSFNYQCGNSLPFQTLIVYPNQTAPQPATQASYDCGSGALLASKDANDLAAGRAGTVYAYDEKGRLQSVTNSDGGLTSYGYLSPVSVQTQLSAVPDPPIITTSVVDPYGRPLRTNTQDGETDTTYDANGRVLCVSNPWSNLQANTCITSYDGLDRPLTQLLQDGVSTRIFSYSANTTTATDERGVSISRTANAFGKLTSVTEPAPAGQATTTYKYDTLGNITLIGQSGVPSSGEAFRSRSFTYDSVSRLVCASAPESTPANTLLLCPPSAASAAPAGATTYSYNLGGNLSTRTDARNITTTYLYDSLNRLRQKNYAAPSGSGTVSLGYVNYGYDGLDENYQPLTTPHDNSLGRLSRVAAPGSASSYGYDEAGRLKSKTDCLPPNCSLQTTTSAKYDQAGNLTDLWYPDPTHRHVTQSFDGVGRLNKVGEGNNQQTYLQSVTHGADGLLDVVTLGNGITQSIARNNRLQVQNISISGALAPLTGQTLLSHTYCYSNCPTGGTANNGSIWGISDDVAPQNSQGFTYDSLNRISSFSVGGQIKQQYQTDSFGNLSGLSNGSPILQFDAANRITNLPCSNSSQPAYDAAGNQLCDFDNAGLPLQFVYDAENRLSELHRGGAAGQPPLWTYLYGGDGSRLEKHNTDSTSETQYVYFGGHVIAERDNQMGWTDYIYAGDRQIARVRSAMPAVHTSGTRPGQSPWYGTVWSLSGQGGMGYTIQDKDVLSFSQKATPNVVGGPTMYLSRDGFINPDDAAGQGMMSAQYAAGGWVNRSVDLSAYVGQTIWGMALPTQGNSGDGHWDLWIANMVITSSTGQTTPMITGNQVTGSLWNGQGSSTPPTIAAEQTPLDWTQPDAAAQAPVFVFSDHLGTAAMEFTAGGWPLSTTQFAPFGQELDAQSTDNTYKYTGLLRDDELQQDHAQFRQFGFMNGRWTSPDPYDGSMIFSNPQSLNRYEYVEDNPLSRKDPSGLDDSITVTAKEPDDFFDLLSSAVSGLVDLLGTGIEDVFGFGHPQMKESLNPRPNAKQKVDHKNPCANRVLTAAGVTGQQQIATAQLYIHSGISAGMAVGSAGGDNTFFSLLGGAAGAYFGYYQAVKTGGPNDIKNMLGPGYHNGIGIDAGNISYGITCPFGVIQCQAAAGFAQLVDALRGKASFGSPFTFMDTPSDNASIRLGQAIRARGCHE